uniref:Uncharacterized protein n=1 Tax=Arundo donax TaxID=35708 RepID=A0A0A9UM93_ARUDO
MSLGKILILNMLLSVIMVDLTYHRHIDDMLEIRNFTDGI